MASALIHVDSMTDSSGRGTPEECVATIKRMRTVPWSYPNFKDDEGNPVWTIALVIDYQPEEESSEQPFRDWIGVANINHFVPVGSDGKDIELPNLDSFDGGEDMSQYEGVGISAGVLNSTTGYAEWFRNLQEAGVEVPEDLSEFTWFEGITGEFKRVVNASSKKGAEIFVLTEFHNHNGNKAKSERAESSGDLPDRLRAAITKSLLASDGSLPKSSMDSVIARNFKGAEIASALKTIRTKSFWLDSMPNVVVGKKTLTIPSEEETDSDSW